MNFQFGTVFKLGISNQQQQIWKIQFIKKIKIGAKHCGQHNDWKSKMIQKWQTKESCTLNWKIYIKFRNIFLRN